MTNKNKLEKRIPNGRGYFMLEDVPRLKELIFQQQEKYAHEDPFLYEGMQVFPEYAMHVIKDFEPNYEFPFNPNPKLCQE